MKVYDNSDNFRRREHIIEVLLQDGEYKGKLITTVYGRSVGLDVLNVIDEDILFDIDQFKFIGCEIELLGEDDYGEPWFKYVLTDDNGNTLTGEDEYLGIKRLIVGVNIIECNIIH